MIMGQILKGSEQSKGNILRKFFVFVEILKLCETISSQYFFLMHVFVFVNQIQVAAYIVIKPRLELIWLTTAVHIPGHA